MSEKMTRITLPNSNPTCGYMDWDERDAAYMIGEIRAHAAYLREQAEQIEAAADSDFQIDVVRGPHVQHHIRTIQQSARKDPSQ